MPRGTQCTWLPHDGKTQSFLGCFKSKVQHKKTRHTIPNTFYVIEDSIRPYTLLSYPVSVHLDIVEFKVPKEANSQAAIDAITNTTEEAKHVTFRTPLQTSKSITKKSTRKQKGKLLLRPIHPWQNQQQIAPFQDHLMPEITLLQDNLRCVRHNFTQENFPKSFDTAGNMPGVYTIHLDPSIPPVQHDRRGPH